MWVLFLSVLPPLCLKFQVFLGFAHHHFLADGLSGLSPATAVRSLIYAVCDCIIRSSLNIMVCICKTLGGYWGDILELKM
jgi:hypothetical protein